MGSLYENLGIDKTVLSGGQADKDLNNVLLLWANDLIDDLTKSLDTETSDNTSGALRESIKPIPSKGRVIEVGISMLDYWDFINKGVRGIGGDREDGSPYELKQTFGQYAFDKPAIKVDESLRQWAGAKGLSVHAVARSIAHKGIKGTQWFDKVFTQDVVNDLIKRVSKAAGKQMGVGIRKTIEKSK